jgi:hypothetical protein
LIGPHLQIPATPQAIAHPLPVQRVFWIKSTRRRQRQLSLTTFTLTNLSLLPPLLSLLPRMAAFSMRWGRCPPFTRGVALSWTPTAQRFRLTMQPPAG